MLFASTVCIFESDNDSVEEIIKEEYKRTIKRDEIKDTRKENKITIR